MAETSSSSAAGEARRGLILTRIIGVPRSLVFETYPPNGLRIRRNVRFSGSEMRRHRGWKATDWIFAGVKMGS
jgi:hypothetical protein